MSNKERKHPSDYLNDLEEWQENQYNPGYWTDGKIPPLLKYPQKPLGILFIISGILALLVVTMAVIKDLRLDNLVGNIAVLGAGLIFLAAGIRIIRTKK